MSTATGSSMNHPAVPAEEGMQWLMGQSEVGTPRHQDAADCYSCLSRDEEGQIRRQSKWRLARSSANTVGVKAEDDIGTVAVQHKFRMMAANLLSRATSQADQETLQKHGLQCRDAYRLSGPLNDDGTCPINNSTFVTKISNDDDRYLLWTFDSKGLLSKKIIGVPGLHGRLGFPLTAGDIEARRAPKGDLIADLDHFTCWIRSQSEGAFLTDDKDETTKYAMDAGRVRTVLGMGQPVGKSASGTTRGRLWHSDLNHPTLKTGKYTGSVPKGSFEGMAGHLAGLALQSYVPQSGNIANLRSKHSNWSRPTCITCRFNQDGSPDSNYSSWAFPVDPEVKPSITLYDYMTFDGGEIKGLVEEITAGRLTGMLGGADTRVTGASSKRGQDESIGTVSRPGSKKKRVV